MAVNKYAKAKEDWSGENFGNNWTIIKKLSCSEYRKIYEEITGDNTKIIKNSHYLCHNNNCGVDTYLERTVIERAKKNGILSKCKGCTGIITNNCWYSTLCRQKNLTKVPDRTVKIKVGDTFGFWKVLEIYNSSDSTDHQIRAKCQCKNCGEIKNIRLDTLQNKNAKCECFKNRSTGEQLVKEYLDKNNIKYKSEYKFPNLTGLGHGNLRYDFAILNNENKVIKLIEFDGEQHFQEAGSYYNETGQVQIHDAIKNEFSKINNIPLLRIAYFEKNEIDSKLNDFLFEIL